MQKVMHKNRLLKERKKVQMRENQEEEINTNGILSCGTHFTYSRTRNRYETAFVQIMELRLKRMKLSKAI